MSDKNIKNIIDAYFKVKENLTLFFKSPDEMEFEILLQFLINKSFSLFESNPKHESDFWSEINEKNFNKYNEKVYKDFPKLKKKRFKEYDTIYNLLLDTNLMRTGTPSGTKDESELIGIWGLMVYSNILPDTPIEMEKLMKFPEVCSIAHAMHMIGMTKMLDFET